MRSSNMFLLLTSSLLCKSLVLQTRVTSALRSHIRLINKVVVTMLVGSGLVLNHQHIILKFGVIGRIQVLSLTVEIHICNHLLFSLIGHIKRLHDSISLPSTQVCLNPHGLRLSPRCLLLTEDGHGSRRARPVHYLSSIFLCLHHLFGRIHIEIVRWHVL